MAGTDFQFYTDEELITLFLKNKHTNLYLFLSNSCKSNLIKTMFIVLTIASKLMFQIIKFVIWTLMEKFITILMNFCELSFDQANRSRVLFHGPISNKKSLFQTKTLLISYNKLYNPKY